LEPDYGGIKRLGEIENYFLVLKIKKAEA